MSPGSPKALNQWSDWHLTPSGWVRGTVQRADERVVVAPPADRVLSYRVHVKTGVGGEEKLERWIIWRLAEDPERVSALLAEHGEGPGEPRLRPPPRGRRGPGGDNP